MKQKDEDDGDYEQTEENPVKRDIECDKADMVTIERVVCK